MMNIQITRGFWGFIEVNVPKHHFQKRCKHLNDIQNFIAGHQSSIRNISIEMAVMMWNDTLLDLCRKAIGNYVTKLPVSIVGETDLHNYAEAIADIAYEAGGQGFRPTGNSRDTISSIIDWADEFTRRHQDTDWNEVEYLDRIWDFIQKKLAAYFHEIEHRCPTCGAGTMKLQYADSNPQEISLYCPSCGGSWEDDKALSVLSGVIKWDKKMYGEEARKVLNFLLKDLDRGQVYSVIRYDKLKICGVYQDKNGKFVAFDNKAGSCFVEEFRLLDTALKWMKGEIEIEERHKYE